MFPTTSGNGKCRYGKEDICFGKFYKAATNTNRRLLRDVVLILYYRTHVTFVEHWPNSFEDYCFDLLGWSRKKYRDSFNGEERNCLTSPVESFEGDVSLLNKILFKLFDEVGLPETFYNAVRDIKNVRNRVCHDQLDFTDELLRTNMEDLKFLIRKLLLELQSAVDIPIHDLLQRYCDEVDEILAAPITGEGTNYFDRMDKFRDDLMGKFITHGRKELFEYYAKLKILNPFSWLRDETFSELQVDKIFTPLHITDKNVSIDLESLLVTEPFDEETQESKGILPSVIVLSGIAGSGKTSLCRYLLYDWRARLNSVINMRAVDLVILIEARNITADSLVTYLQQSLLKETCSHFEEKDILPTLQTLNVLYVFDGMDEATANGRKVIDEVFSILGNSRVIITTRPEFTSSLVWSILNYHLNFRKLQIHGFSEKGVFDFASKIFQTLESNEIVRKNQEMECCRFLRTSGRILGDHLKVPLTLAFLIILWREDKSTLTKIKSISRLYKELFKMCSLKMLSRIKKTSSSSCLDLETFIDEWLLELGNMAYTMVIKEEFVITDNRRKFLSSICSKYSVDSVQVLSAFLICEVHQDINGIHYSFSFIHKSQMEYLAGLYHATQLLQEYEKKQESLPSTTERMRWLKIFENSKEDMSFSDIMKLRKMENVLKFTLGHLSMQENKVTDLIVKIAKKLLEMNGSSFRVSTLWRIVQESECHPTICELVGKAISDKFLWKPEGEELCDPLDPTMQLLKYTSFIPKGVMIRIIGSINSMLMIGDDDSLERRPYTNVLPILQVVANLPGVYVVMRVDQHFYNWGDEETTDDLIVKLIPNGRLTGFMGHLGVKGAKAFGLLHEVEVVNVRISSAEALTEFCKSVSKINRKAYLEITLRLDIDKENKSLSFPKFDNYYIFNIILKDISDENVESTCQMLNQLGSCYDEVHLVSSTLTKAGVEIFLKDLSKCVFVKEKISIISTNPMNVEDKDSLSQLIECKFEWW